MKWILILSFFELTSNFGGGARAAAAIESIPGFDSEAACATAGKEFLKTWGAENTKDRDGNQDSTARFTCVKQ